MIETIIGDRCTVSATTQLQRIPKLGEGGRKIRALSSGRDERDEEEPDENHGLRNDTHRDHDHALCDCSLG
jgi:hypothetical protein